MVELRAGVGKTIVTPRIGAELIGYDERYKGSTGIHDDLYARALVLDNGEVKLAICSVDILWLWASTATEVRDAVAHRCDIRAENILVFGTHTHAGPAPHNPDDWDVPLVDRIAEAIGIACDSCQAAKIGFGFGQLLGYSINRRWLNRPTDPSVGVIRVDTAEGRPLSVISNFACHGVVLGYDNYLISGDWPGYSSRLIEQDLGAGVVALYSQGGSADVNPLTETVRQRLAAAHPVGTIGELTSYYGTYSRDDPATWNIEDRAGGTFFEAETLARAYNAEVLRVWRSIKTTSNVPMWVERVVVNGAVGPDEPPAEGIPEELKPYVPEVADGSIPMEVMMVGVGPALLVSEPGEVFSETAIELRRSCQQMGYGFPWLVSYANGSYAYLPPDNAFDEGGYEVKWARRVGVSRHLHQRIAEAIRPILKQHVSDK